MVDSYLDNPNVEFNNHDKKVLKLIHDDVVRTIPDSPLFREAKVQQMLERYVIFNGEFCMFGISDTLRVDMFKDLTI